MHFMILLLFNALCALFIFNACVLFCLFIMSNDCFFILSHLSVCVCVVVVRWRWLNSVLYCSCCAFKMRKYHFQFIARVKLQKSFVILVFSAECIYYFASVHRVERFFVLAMPYWLKQSKKNERHEKNTPNMAFIIKNNGSIVMYER